MSTSRNTIEDAKWVAEQSLAAFHHYSGLRLQLTVLNVTAMGALIVLLKETPTENAYDEITVRWGLLFISVVFTILSFRVSSAAGFQWGLYQNARNIVINASEVLEAKKENVQQDYETRMLWKPVTENRKGRRHWYGFTWGFFNRIPNYLFWPLLNFLAPILAIIVLL